MNLYEKILEIKNSNEVKSIQKEGFGGAGKGYAYFESQKVVSVISDMCYQYKILTIFTFEEKEVILNLINIENIEDILELRSFMPEILPMNKGSNGMIQGVGSYHTYMKRYMFMDLFDICERDIETFNREENTQEKPSQKQEEEEDQDKVYRTAGDVISYATILSKDNKSSTILKNINKLHAPLNLKQDAREQLIQNSIMIKKYDDLLSYNDILRIVKFRLNLNKQSKTKKDYLKVLDTYCQAGLIDKETCLEIVMQKLNNLKENSKGELII